MILLSLGTSLTHAQDTEIVCTVGDLSGDAMEFSVTNELDEAITLFWVSPDCDEIAYLTIAPAETMAQGTSVNHEWVIRTSDGTVVERYTASPDRTDITISAAAQGDTAESGTSFPFAATMVSENLPDLLSAPGGDRLTHMNSNEAITVTGISEDGEWFSIIDSVGSQGWVPVSGVVLPENVTISSPDAAVSAHDAHWGYDGETGPEHWGELEEGYEACAVGRAQSPIDLGESTEVNLVDIQFNYSESAVNIVNNGHTIQVNVDPGSSITYNEIRYDLQQFHFHHPSEHLANEQPMAMEVHFVHQSHSGSYAVVGALIVAGENPNATFAPVFDHLPVHESEPASVGAIRLIDLLPAGAGHLTYVGSLTTPPCSEGVRWLLVDEFVVLTQAQIDAFAAIFPLNARPVQPLNNRDLLWNNQ